LSALALQLENRPEWVTKQGVQTVFVAPKQNKPAQLIAPAELRMLK
jgi:hypothetical protein